MKDFLIAITGGMGCGKSAASAAFAELGVKTLDADALAHRVLDSDPRVAARVRALLGADVYKNGVADRAEISRRVFADARLLAGLEGIVHPAVEAAWCAAARGCGIAAVEVPLLFEKKLESKFDLCISVYCSDRLRRERLGLRGMSEFDVRARDAFQMPPAQKAAAADVVLFNESSREFLKAQARKVLSRLKR